MDPVNTPIPKWGAHLSTVGHGFAVREDVFGMGTIFEQVFSNTWIFNTKMFVFLFISDKSKMHTFLTRANALAAYTMSVLAALTFMCFLSTFLFETYSAPAKMNTVKVVVKHVPDYSASREKNDLGMDFFIPGR